MPSSSYHHHVAHVQLELVGTGGVEGEDGAVLLPVLGPFAPHVNKLGHGLYKR